MLAIRLSRAGTKNRPFYHVVVSESTRTPTSRVTDRLGYYDPLRKPKVVQIDVARADEWISKGAHPSPTVRTLIEQARNAPAVTATAETIPEEPTATEPAATEPASAEPAAPEAAATEPASAEPASAEPAPTDRLPEEA